MTMPYETENRLKSFLNANQLGREQMCRSILAIDRRFSEVTPRHPNGGPDGGRDIQALFKEQQLAYGAVGFVNDACDSVEQKKKIKKKFKDDLTSALKGTERPEVFVFLTNLNLTVGEKNSLEHHAKLKGIHICEIMDRERLRITLDSPDGFSTRFQYLSLPLSEPEQASFFAKWGTEIDNVISTGFQSVNSKLDRILFLHEANEILEDFVITYQLDREYSADEIGHFRAFCYLYLKAPTDNAIAVIFGKSDKSARFRNDLTTSSESEPKGIKHGISAVAWESLLFTEDEEGKRLPLEQHDERFRPIYVSSGIGCDKVEFLPIRFGYHDFIRLQDRPKLKDYNDASFLPILSHSFAKKVTAIHLYANGYKLDEYAKSDLAIDDSSYSLNVPVKFSRDELRDPWVRIRPSNISSTFTVSFSNRTPRRLYSSPSTNDSLSHRRRRK